MPNGKTFDPVADIEEFHRHFGVNYDGKPRMLPAEALKFRLMFLREELREYEGHCEAASFELDKLQRPGENHDVSDVFHFDNANFVHHMAQALDSLVDLAYVTFGTAHLHGFDMREAWTRVHAANMAKQRPADMPRTSEERFKMKIIKPEGWEPPKHDDLVEDHVHTSPQSAA